MNTYRVIIILDGASTVESTVDAKSAEEAMQHAVGDNGIVDHPLAANCCYTSHIINGGSVAGAVVAFRL
jgi:hypothetical protein